MSLKITYVSEKTEPEKKINWRTLVTGTVYKVGDYFICLKTDKSFIILVIEGGRELVEPTFGYGHGWNDQSIEILGKLIGIEVTK